LTDDNSYDNPKEEHVGTNSLEDVDLILNSPGIQEIEYLEPNERVEDVGELRNYLKTIYHAAVLNVL
jgi:hypothetical protein